MENGKRLLVTKCGHVFHLNCLSKHFYYKKDKCPICKTCIIEFSIPYINTKLSLLNNYEEIKKYIYGLTTDEKNAIDPMVQILIQDHNILNSKYNKLFDYAKNMDKEYTNFMKNA